MAGPLLYENRSEEKLSDSNSMHELLKKGKSSYLLHQKQYAMLSYETKY